MYHAPILYNNIRCILLLWESMLGVMLLWNQLPKRKMWKGSCAASFLLGSAAVLLAQKLGFEHYPVLAYMICIAMVSACCEVPVWSAMMVGSSGYLFQHISGNLSMCLRTFTPIGSMVDNTWWLVLYNLVIYALCYWVMWRVFRDLQFREDDRISVLNKVAFSLMAVLFSFGFYFINAYVRGWENLNPVELGVNSLYAFAGSCFIMIMQYDIMKNTRAQREINAMRVLLQTQTAQYQASVENAALVNEKYHDLKTLLQSFQGNVSGQYLEKLNTALDAYDDRVDTGSQIADILLMEKRGVCRRHGIQMSCYVHGEDFAFMEELELYSLLKNALDNAIEAVKDFPEEGNRFISLTTHRNGKAVILHMENPCGQVDFEQGYPKTRRDQNFHGFGIKSMTHIAEKYNGNLAAKVENGIFMLDVLMFPD